MKKRKPMMRRKISVPRDCSFCAEKKEPGFEDSQTLGRFLTERGKKMPRVRNGLCAKHQRALSENIKYARHLALLPFVVRN